MVAEIVAVVAATGIQGQGYDFLDAQLEKMFRKFSPLMIQSAFMWSLCRATRKFRVFQWSKGAPTLSCGPFRLQLRSMNRWGVTARWYRREG